MQHPGARLLELVLSGHAFSRPVLSSCPNLHGVFSPRFTNTHRLNPSSSWLIAQGRLKEAEHSIALTYGVSSTDETALRLVRAEVDEIANQTERERLLKSGWIDCFRPSNKTLYRTLLGMSLQSFQQLTGANYFFYYGATIFESVGINDSFVTQIILGAVNFVCTFGGLYVMERVRLFFSFSCTCC